MSECSRGRKACDALIEQLQAELSWAHSVIEYEVEPPHSCGACGTPNAACDGTCADAAYFANHMRAIRRLIRPGAMP